MPTWISRRIFGKGENVIAATVWNFGDVAPAFQQIVATGFRLIGDPVSTSAPGWRVRIDTGHSAVNGKEQISWQYYVASAPEVIDARKAPSDWQDAVPAPAAAARTLIADPLPPQLFASAAPGQRGAQLDRRRRAVSRATGRSFRRTPPPNYSSGATR